MATVTLNLKAKLTKAENNEANALLAAALNQNSDEVADRLERPAIKKMLKRGALKISHRTHEE